MEESTQIQGELIVPKRHLTSLPGEDLPLGVEIRELFLDQGACNEFTCRSNKVLLVVQGQVECAQDGYPAHIVEIDNMFFVRVGMQCRITACRESLLVLLRPGAEVNQKDSASQAYTIGIMSNTTTKNLLDLPTGQLPILPFNCYIRNFVAGLLHNKPYAAGDEFYAGVKIREFFFLLGMSYSEKDRARFFESLDSAEQSFAAFIYRNYKQASSVKDLAAMACYSLSGFEKRFRKVFGQPASRWIARQKALMIYTEICDTSKPFKTLSYEYGFSCPSHFTRFCRKHLGKTPLAIRQQKIEQNRDKSVEKGI